MYTPKWRKINQQQKDAHLYLCVVCQRERDYRERGDKGWTRRRSGEEGGSKEMHACSSIADVKIHK